MDFINMTSTGKETIEVDVREFNQMILDCQKLNLLEWGGVFTWKWYDASLCDGFEAFWQQMEQANNFKE